MKTRVIVHVALNAKNERVEMLVEVAGRLIPFEGMQNLNQFKGYSLQTWVDPTWATSASLKNWKSFCKKVGKAVRFQRVMLEG